MLDVRLTSDLPRLSGRLRLLTDRQLRYAVAGAMTEAAEAAQAALRRDMPRYIDRPTPFTLDSTYVSFARPNRLSAEVGFKQSAVKGTPAGRYLSPMARGGDREPTRAEGVLRRSGVIRSGQYILPARSWRTDPYGNVPRTTYILALSQLRAFSASGATQNASQSRRSRASRERAGEFFMSRSRRAVLYRAPGARREDTEVAFIVLEDAPNYERTYPIRQLLETDFERAYPRVLRTRLSAELARAGFA